jgi:predicted transcriptional regulator
MNEKVKLSILKVFSNDKTILLSQQDIFEKIESNINWDNYIKLSVELEKDGMLYDTNDGLRITELGIKLKDELTKSIKESEIDKAATRGKLRNEHRLSKFKLTTFIITFVLALLSAAYSTYDFITTYSKSDKDDKNIMTREETQYELDKLRTLILTKETSDSLDNHKSISDSIIIN